MNLKISIFCSILFFVLNLASFSADEKIVPPEQQKKQSSYDEISKLFLENSSEFLEKFRNLKNNDKLAPLGLDFTDSFSSFLTKLMAKETGKPYHIILSIICRPSFDREYGIFMIRLSKNKYNLIIIEAKEQIWPLYDNNQIIPDKLYFLKKTIPISDIVAKKLWDIWYDQLASIRYDPCMAIFSGLDGTSYQFSISVPLPTENLSGVQVNGARKNILTVISDNIIKEKEHLTSDLILKLIQNAYDSKRKEIESIGEKNYFDPETQENMDKFIKSIIVYDV